MKLSIIHNRDIPPESSYIQVHFSELNQIESSLATEILLLNTIDFIDEQIPFLKICTSKLRLNGTITIIGSDIITIAERILNGGLPPNQLKDFVYGGRKSISSIEFTKAWLEDLGLKIEFADLDLRTNKYTIQAKRIK